MHEPGDNYDLARGIFLNGWNGRGLTGDGGLIESEEDCAEEGHGLVVWVGAEIGMDVNDEGRADRREQTRLREQVRWLTRARVDDG